MGTKQRVCSPQVLCCKIVAVIARKQILETAMARLNNVGRRVQMFPLIFEMVHMQPGWQKHVKGTTLCRSQHMSNDTLRGIGQFYIIAKMRYRYPWMAHSHSKTLSRSIDLCACRAAWKSMNVHCWVKRENTSWWRTSCGLGQPTLSLERRCTGQMYR